jgi:hypothetical protein
VILRVSAMSIVASKSASISAKPKCPDARSRYVHRHDRLQGVVINAAVAFDLRSQEGQLRQRAILIRATRTNAGVLVSCVWFQN